MTPHYQDDNVQVIAADCLDALRELPPDSADAVVTDPPYGLEFMGKEWDAFKPASARIRKPSARDAQPGSAHNTSTFLAARNMPDAIVAGHPFQQWCELWTAECLRVLKPGGHMLAFGGTRTSHRLACAIEDAGFEVRDSIAWLYGSGFPKSLDVSKAIDKAAGAEREIVGRKGGRYATPKQDFRGGQHHSGADTSKTAVFDAITAPATDDAATWQGWGTALKPAHEPVIVARKPLQGTVAANVLTHGTGALNIDGCRVGDGLGSKPRVDEPSQETRYTDSGGTNFAALPGVRGGSPSGRWPANVILDESQAAALDEQTGILASGDMTGAKRKAAGGNGVTHGAMGPAAESAFYGDKGGASRFFYVAKAPKSERPRVDGIVHPTVKPIKLMRWMVRLVTPPGGTVLDPFAGSGTTVEACILEGFRCIAIERESTYLPLITHRIERAMNE